jgi:hypothetical protein
MPRFKLSTMRTAALVEITQPHRQPHFLGLSGFWKQFDVRIWIAIYR